MAKGTVWLTIGQVAKRTGLSLSAIRFYEERYRSIGPLGKFQCDECYPESIYPGPNTERHAGGTEPSENAFDLSNPVDPEQDSRPPNPDDRPPLPPSPMPPVPQAKPEDNPQE